MKQIMTALVLITIAQNAAAAKLVQADFENRRVMIIDQAKNEFTGLMTIGENFTGQLQGQTGAMSLDCQGIAAVEYTRQTVESLMKCKNGQDIRITLSLPQSDEDVSYLLQDGLAPAKLDVKSREGAAFTKVIYSGDVEIKRLAK